MITRSKPNGRSEKHVRPHQLKHISLGLVLGRPPSQALWFLHFCTNKGERETRVSDWWWFAREHRQEKKDRLVHFLLPVFLCTQLYKRDTWEWGRYIRLFVCCYQVTKPWQTTTHARSCNLQSGSNARPFVATNSRGIQQPYWRAKVALGQDKQKANVI